jgi:biotin synthase
MTAIAPAERPITAPATDIRSNWTRQEILELFALPFNDLIHRAHETHRRHFDPNAVLSLP